MRSRPRGGIFGTVTGGRGGFPLAFPGNQSYHPGGASGKDEPSARLRRRPGPASPPCEILMRVIPGVLAPLVAVLLAPAIARGESDSKVFLASDFPQLARGIGIDRDGDYTIKVWSPAKLRWHVEAAGSGITLSSEVEGTDVTPSWTALGPVALKAGRPVAIEVAGASFVPVEIVGDYKSEKQKVQPKPAGAPVPAVLSLSTDSSFVPDLGLLRGRTDSIEPVQDSRRDRVRTNHEGASFRVPATAEGWGDRSRNLREQLRVTLGLAPMPPKTPLNPRVYGRIDREGYSIEKVALETMPGFFLAGNLYRPAGNCRRVPAVLCPHGHWEDGRVNPDVQARCIHLAKLGFVVFLYDMVGYNDSEEFGHKFLDDRLDLHGFSLPTLQTWNSLRAVDWLTTLPDVDPARIGCTGESGGGTQTFLLSALDPRVAVSAPVVMVSERFQGGCACENASGLRHGTDNVEIAALAAPRPMMLVGATGDWSSNTTTKVHSAIRGVYERVGEPEHVEAAIFDFPHNYNQTSRNAVYAFLSRRLLNIDDASGTREGDQAPEKPEDLRVFDAEHPSPSGTKTPEALEADLVALRERQLAKLAPGEDATAWEAARKILATAHRVRVGVEPPSPKTIVGRLAGRASREGIGIAHWTLSREGGGEGVPVVRLTPEKPSGRVAIVSHDRGKAGLFEARGEPSPIARALLDRGVGVVGFDPLLVGEAFDPSSPADRRPRTAHFLAYNPALAADRMRDLALVLAWTRSQADVRQVSLVGLGAAGPLALLARPSLDGVARAYVDLEGFDYGDGSDPVSEGLKLPGVFQFGGLEGAAALAAPEPLWVGRPGRTFERSWPEKAFALADCATALRVCEDAPSAESVARWIDTGDH